MERFIFKDYLGKEDKELLAAIIRKEDKKAFYAKELADEIMEAQIQDNNKYAMFILMQIAFESNVAQISFMDIAQFYYDNYTQHQISGLHQALTNQDGIVTNMIRAESFEEAQEKLAALKKKMENV